MGQKAMRLGILGGTFNPPHIGHQILASEALIQFDLDKVLWVLTPFPPHKMLSELPPLLARQEMLRLALEGNPYFELCLVDIDRPPPHYAVDTLRILHQVFPSSTLVYLMGSDSLDDLPDWYDPPQFVQQCDEIGVMLRPDHNINQDELDRQLPGIQSRLRFLDAPLLEISSSKLREKIFKGGAYRYYLPPSVWTFIESNSLYTARIEDAYTSK